jgi:RNA-binding protein YhbY
LLKEIEKQLEKREMVKVKILKSALQEGKVNEIASTIAEQTEAALVEVRGHTFMLYKHRQKHVRKTNIFTIFSLKNPHRRHVGKTLKIQS